MLYSVKLSIKSKGEIGTSLVVQYLGPQLPVLGMQVWSLVGEIRSNMSCGQKNQNIKQKQYFNKFNADFKIIHIKKKSLKK